MGLWKPLLPGAQGGHEGTSPRHPHLTPTEPQSPEEEQARDRGLQSSARLGASPQGTLGRRATHSHDGAHARAPVPGLRVHKIPQARNPHGHTPNPVTPMLGLLRKHTHQTRALKGLGKVDHVPPPATGRWHGRSTTTQEAPDGGRPAKAVWTPGVKVLRTKERPWVFQTEGA